MNWYKKAQFTEKLDDGLIDMLEKFKEPSEGKKSQQLYLTRTPPTDEELIYFTDAIDAIAKDKGITLTEEQHKWLQKKIELQRKKDKNRNLYQSVEQALGDLERSAL